MGALVFAVPTALEVVIGATLIRRLRITLDTPDDVFRLLGVAVAAGSWTRPTRRSRSWAPRRLSSRSRSEGWPS
ncbi:MAG: hypothetical protein ABIR11_12500 [Candidatus Limnocylindrales bacterium]